jgi:hypothetical protein
MPESRMSDLLSKFSSSSISDPVWEAVEKQSVTYPEIREHIKETEDLKKATQALSDLEKMTDDISKKDLVVQDVIDILNSFTKILNQTDLHVTNLKFDANDICERSNESWFVPFPGKNFTGDSSNLRIIKRGKEFIIDASRTINDSASQSVAKNNLNQLLHLIFLNSIKNSDGNVIPNIIKIENINTCSSFDESQQVSRTGRAIRKIRDGILASNFPVIGSAIGVAKGISAVRELTKSDFDGNIHGVEVILEQLDLFDGLEEHVNLLEFLTQREIALQIWNNLPNESKKKCYAQSEWKNYIEEAVYTDDSELNWLAFNDIVNEILHQVIEGTIKIQEQMNSMMFLSLSTILVIPSKSNKFGIQVKFWPNEYSIFTKKLNESELNVFPMVRFDDYIPYGEGILDSIIKLFVKGEDRLDNISISDSIQKILSQKIFKPGENSNLVHIASNQLYSQSYDILRIAYEIMLLSPLYTEDASYRSFFSMYDTPLLNGIFSHAEKSQLYFHGIQSTQLQNFKTMAGSIIKDQLIRYTTISNSLIKIIREPPLPISVTLSKLSAQKHTYDESYRKRMSDSSELKHKLKEKATFLSDSFDLKIKDNILPHIYSLIKQGAIGKIFSDLQKLKPIDSVPSFDEFTKFEIARGGGGAVFRVKVNEIEYALKLPLVDAKFKPSKHTNFIEQDENKSVTIDSFQSDPNFTELVVTIQASELYSNNISPHFIKMNNVFKHTKGLALVMEKIHGDMFKADSVFTKIIQANVESGIKEDDCPSFDALANNVVVQTLFAIKQFQTELNGMHNDLHLANVFLKICDDTEYNGKKLYDIPEWTYEFEDIGKFSVPNLGVLVKIGDFGLSTTQYKSQNDKNIRLSSFPQFSVGSERTIDETEIGQRFIKNINGIFSKFSSDFDLNNIITNMIRGTTSKFHSSIDYIMFIRHCRLHPRFQQTLIVFEQKLNHVKSLYERSKLATPDKSDAELYEEARIKTFDEKKTFDQVHLYILRLANKKGARSLMAEIQSLLLAKQNESFSFNEFVQISSVMSMYGTEVEGTARSLFNYVLDTHETKKQLDEEEQFYEIKEQSDEIKEQSDE